MITQAAVWGCWVGETWLVGTHGAGALRLGPVETAVHLPPAFEGPKRTQGGCGNLSPWKSQTDPGELDAGAGLEFPGVGF